MAYNATALIDEVNHKFLSDAFEQFSVWFPSSSGITHAVQPHGKLTSVDWSPAEVGNASNLGKFCIYQDMLSRTSWLVASVLHTSGFESRTLLEIRAAIVNVSSPGRTTRSERCWWNPSLSHKHVMQVVWIRSNCPVYVFFIGLFGIRFEFIPCGKIGDWGSLQPRPTGFSHSFDSHTPRL